MTCKGSRTHKFTAIETLCTRPAQAQAGQNSNMEHGDAHEAPPLTTGLLTNYSFREMESQLSLRVQPQVGLIMSFWGPHV